MKLTILASGSKGNSAVLSGGRTRILLDAGLSCRELFRRMREVGEDPEQLDAIVITHEHVDHVNGLAVTARRLGIPVYITRQTQQAWARMMTPRTTMTYAKWIEMRRQQAVACQQPGTEQSTSVMLDAAAPDLSEGLQDMEPEAESTIAAMSAGAEEASEVVGAISTESKTGNGAAERSASDLPAVENFTAGTSFSIGDFTVIPFTIPHDAADPVGFVFEAGGVRVGVATDLGYVPPNVKLALSRCHLLVLESNHDLEMLRDGPYPWQVKQRVLSRVGHLSNDAAAEFLAEGYDGGAEYVVLAHLSESNNLPELARLAAEKALAARATLLSNRLLLAQQTRPLEAICL
jgi:phosphoribosyl 1,2-cyclic phosphodiesterase